MLWLMTYESMIDYFFTIIKRLSIPQRCNVVLISFMISEVVLLSPGNFILSPPLLEISVSVVICVKKNGGHWPPSSYIEKLSGMSNISIVASFLIISFGSKYENCLLIMSISSGFHTIGVICILRVTSVNSAQPMNLSL